MENNILKCFSFDYKTIIIDEVALNGLEGIGLNLLWKHVENRLGSPVTDKMKNRWWNLIMNCDSIKIYLLPEPLPDVEIVDRFMLVDEDTGLLKDAGYVDGPYEYCPIKKDHGSCVHYDTRVLVDKKQFQNISYDKVVSEYGNMLVMVASIEERWRALVPHLSLSYLSQLSSIQYCLLESIGRGRSNGQLTIGKTNLTKIVKESKLLFYYRKHLCTLDMIKVQTITIFDNGRGNKCLLLRLKRYHQSVLETLPKVGKIRNIVEYLLQKPGYCEKTEVMIKLGLLNKAMNKRLQKTANVFSFNEKEIASEDTGAKKYKRRSTSQKKRYISLDCNNRNSDESSHSDEETFEDSMTELCLTRTDILEHCNDVFLKTGLKGLTQIELAKRLSAEFYTSRTLCRMFKGRHVIREFLEDKGRQRTARYIAIAATAEMDGKYEAERKKFLEYCSKRTTTEDTDLEKPPIKKIKLEDSQDNTEITIDNETVEVDMECDIADIKEIGHETQDKQDSILNTKKNLTLRQLRFANGILKVTREHLCVVGYQKLSSLVAEEIKEPPMDAKALKTFLMKLIADKQLKIIKVKRPFYPFNYIMIICAPHIKRTDPIILKKYKEMCERADRHLKSKNKKQLIESTNRPMSMFAYPRFVKTQKLHEFLVKLAHEDKIKSYDNLPQGFLCLSDIMPEITVEFAIGNINNVAALDIPHLNLNDSMFDLKLRDAPPVLCKTILKSSSLQNSLKVNVKLLAMLGLVQLVKKSNTGFDFDSLFYINKHAKIIDTTGTWPKKDMGVKNMEKSYNFKTMNDVFDYWKDVNTISLNTIIELPGRCQKKINPPIRLQNEVLWHDNGERYGDGMGPCGFDSGIYMDIPRLWRSFYMRVAKHVKLPLRKSKKVRIPKIDASANKTKKTNKQKQKSVPKNIREKGNAKTPFNKPGKRKTNDSSLRWSHWEDLIITMCKAAISIMSPSSQPGCLRVRNSVARDILTLVDPKKTFTVCHKRAIALESNVTLAHEKECIVNELRRRQNLVKKYEGLLKKIRIRNSLNLTKYVNEARVQMLELVWLITQMVKSNSYNRRTTCVAISHTDFHNNFTIIPASLNKATNYYHTPIDQPELATIKEAVLFTVLLSNKEDLDDDISMKIYSTFSVFPESILRTALEQLRKSGAIAVKDKIFNAQLRRLNSNELQAPYKASVMYQRRWLSNRFNVEFIEKVAEYINSKIPQNCVKASASMNCILCELQSCDILNIVTTTAPIVSGSADSIIQENQYNVIDVEMKYKMKSGTIGWESKSDVTIFSELYQWLELDEPIRDILGNSVALPIENKYHSDDDDIVLHIRKAAESGITFRELQELSGCASTTLVRKLNELESNNVIKRVGYQENRIILAEHISTWSLKVNEKYGIPSPWSTIDFDGVNYEIYLNWAGVVMNKVFENPGCPITFISDTTEYLTNRSAQEICMFLEKCKCITMQIVEPTEPDLFSDVNLQPEFTEFNKYDSPDNILVFPVKDSLIKFAYIKKTVVDKFCTEEY